MKTVYVSKATILFVISFVSTVSFAKTSCPQTDNDMQYAMTYAKDYSYGDDGQTHDPTCWYYEGEGGDGFGAITVIQCEGVQNILVHGGEMRSRTFSCNFEFEPNLLEGQFWIVTQQGCQ